jgi:hypothetical protein
MPLDSTTFAPSTLVEDLRAAREYIVTHGWCQNVSIDNGRACAVGGIFAVVGGRMCTYEDTVRRQVAFDALRKTLVGRGISCPVADWNDAPERTVEDVLDLYDATIRGLVE